jgi:phosphoribosylformylglycinamidine cyclo-ligase
VRAVLDLLRSGARVHGLAHITGGGLLNLLRLNERAGFAVEDPLPVPPVIELVRERGGVSAAEAWEVFNMGCGFCVVVPAADASSAADLLRARHPGTSIIGEVTADPGVVALPGAGLVARAGSGFTRASS